MKNLLIACILLLAACTKTTDKQSAIFSNNKIPESCSFGITEFNKIKRISIPAEQAKGKPGSTNSNSSNNVIFLDFGGEYITGTYWNTSGDFNCAPANMTGEEISIILERVRNDFAPFNVTVTTDESVYNFADPYKRTKVVVTESWEWYGQVGGVSFLNSFTWGNNTPCFVFSTLLGYNVKMIAEACSHEVGHTLGLRHQSLYDANGVKLDEYNWGQGSGEIGWAPIMGASYNQNLSLWHNGSSSLSSTSLQDDVARIASVTGFLPDDYTNSISGAKSLGSSAGGIINNPGDIDFFSITLRSTKTISLTPSNVGANNEGGNLDLILKIYNSQGQLISSVNDEMTLNAGITLSKGSYYISAGTCGNIYSSTYGMVSRYNIAVN